MTFTDSALWLGPSQFRSRNVRLCVFCPLTNEINFEASDWPSEYMISSQASHWPPTFKMASVAQSGRVPDRMQSGSDPFQIRHIPDWMSFGSDSFWTRRGLDQKRSGSVFWIGHI